MSVCLEREGGRSTAKITVVQVFCHLQPKSVLIITEAQPLIELRHWQKGRASIPWKRNGASSPSMPLGHIPWSKTLRSSSICNISRLPRCHIRLVECQNRRDDLPFTWCSLSCNSKCLKRGLGIEGILKEINRNRPWVVLREGQTVQLTQSHESSCTMTGGFGTRCPKRGYLQHTEYVQLCYKDSLTLPCSRPSNSPVRGAEEKSIRISKDRGTQTGIWMNGPFTFPQFTTFSPHPLSHHVLP